MRRRFALGATLLLAVGLVLAQEPTQPPEITEYAQRVEFRYAGLAVLVPQAGPRVEILPVLAMVGAEAQFSRAANTYGVIYGDSFIQFALDRRYVLVNGTLQEAPDVPIASPAGVAASIAFLERALLSPMGFHLEPMDGGYRIMPGARYADPVAVRPAAADFGATTTLVLTLNRPVSAEVEATEVGDLVVQFDDASPQLDTNVPFRSRRVRTLRSRGQDLVVDVASGVGLLNWHLVEDPPRIILELGALRPTPTPAPVRIVERRGPPPIVIDPGHGGEDTGAKAPSGMMEKDLVLAVARRLSQHLNGRGHTVRLTREGDESRALTDRAALANRLEAKVFVSLHANASTVAAVRGAETYYMSLDETATDEQAAATADLENRPATQQSSRSALDLILWDLAQAEVLNESAELALRVQRRLNASMGLRDRGVKQAPFVVLTGATMPAILVEVGFVSNPSEAQLLKSPAHQQRLAEAIAAGIDDFVRSQ
jgi:N-acetylmuramoyl-L-alanine amidase